LSEQSQGADRPLTGRRFTTLAVLVLVAAFLWQGTPVSKFAKATRPKSTIRLAAPVRTSTCKIYPFSVIYGGAHSGEELARARKLDAVVARHYAGFGEHPAVERIPQDAFMYVSYRKANQVYWTKTKHRIPHGEPVLYDGENLARTRCGNRLSPKPQAPVSSEGDPTEEAMDVPDGPKPTLASASPIGTAPEADFFIPGSPADAGSSPANPKNAAGGAGISENPYAFGSRPGIGGPFIGGVGYRGFPGASGGTAVNSGGDTVNSAGIADNAAVPENGMVTPEPGTLPLLFMGLLLGSPALVRYWRNRAHTSRRNK